jgi:hypothetical protein
MAGLTVEESVKKVEDLPEPESQKEKSGLTDEKSKKGQEAKIAAEAKV